MADESTVVRPPEFKKVLEELHAVRLANNLKMEIQGRRDLEEVYHQALEEIAALEDTNDAKQQELTRAEADVARALRSEATVLGDNQLLRRRLMRVKIVCYLLLALVAILLIVARNDLIAIWQSLAEQSAP